MKITIRPKMLSMVSVLLFTGTHPLTVSAQAAPDLPPPLEAPPTRILIPMHQAEEKIGEGNEKKLTETEIAAFAIAATAKGWIPENSSGILRNGMLVKITVMVNGIVEHDTEPQRITHSGKIGLPLLQNVDVGGMDLEVAETMLTQKYSEYWVEPLVNISFVGDVRDPSQSPWGYVTIMGNVAQPGPLAMPPTQLLTISGAVKYSGGLSVSANKDAIKIFRPHPKEQTVEKINVDLDKLARGEQAEDVSLRAGDVVFIPERIF